MSKISEIPGLDFEWMRGEVCHIYHFNHRSRAHDEASFIEFKYANSPSDFCTFFLTVCRLVFCC